MREDRGLSRSIKRPLMFASYVLATQLVMASPVGGGVIYRT